MPLSEEERLKRINEAVARWREEVKKTRSMRSRIEGMLEHREKELQQLRKKGIAVGIRPPNIPGHDNPSTQGGEMDSKRLPARTQRDWIYYEEAKKRKSKGAHKYLKSKGLYDLGNPTSERRRKFSLRKKIQGKPFKAPSWLILGGIGAEIARKVKE